jgi:hypothetical protein
MKPAETEQFFLDYAKKCFVMKTFTILFVLTVRACNHASSLFGFGLMLHAVVCIYVL